VVVGASALILLPRTPKPDNIDRLWGTVGSLCEGGDVRRSGNHAHFDVCTTFPIGGCYRGDSRPFALGLDVLNLEYDEADLEDISRVIGFWPKRCIGIVAFQRDPRDQRILGEMCLALARRFHGIVDFGGAIVAPGTESELNFPRGQLFRWTGHSFPARGPVSHLADAKFMREWLGYPAFHML
jgi:hypothetical protein